MSVFDDETPPPTRTPVALGLVAVIAVAAVAWFMMPASKPLTPAASAPTAAPAAAPAPKAAAPPPAKAAEARRPAPKAQDEPAPAPAAAPAAADAATLVIEADVPGASIFVDREFVGTAPVTLKAVAPGTKRINASAEGFDGVQRSVEVAAGENATVAMRFKEVKLDASVAVSHKHGMGGGCEGTLHATIDGLAYQTSNKGDAFSLKYEQLDAFEVNYLEKNLRVKQKGGKTWNFTDRGSDNADKLFVFQRDVQAARDKLAKGYAAAR